MKVGYLGVVVGSLALVLVLPCSSAAQNSRGTIGLIAGSYTVDADAVDGTLPASGVGGSVNVHRWLDIEGEFLRPFGTVSRSYQGVAFSLAGAGASREEIERLGVVTAFTNKRRVPAALSIGVAFHPQASGSRIEPRLFVGTTTHFAREEGIREPLSWPATITREEILRMQPRLESSTRALGSFTIGGSVAIAVTRHIALMPDVRYDYGSIGDEINNSTRASLRLLYRF